MQIGVYGSGYLGTVISACLADFGTPVSCCHPDRTRMVEMAQGNVPFFEKNLKEIIRRNVLLLPADLLNRHRNLCPKNTSHFPGRRQGGELGRCGHAHCTAGVQASDSLDRELRFRWGQRANWKRASKTQACRRQSYRSRCFSPTVAPSRISTGPTGLFWAPLRRKRCTC